MDVLCTLKIKLESQNQIIGVSKTSDYIQIKIKMPNQNQEPSASSIAPNDDLKDMDVLCTFKIKIESQNLDNGYIKDQWPYLNKIKLPNSSQEPSASSKAPSLDLKDMYVLCNFKIKKDLFLDIVSGLWYTNDLNFSSQSWFWRCKEHPCPLSPHLGLWRTLEVPDWGLASWYWFGYGHWSLVHPYAKFCSLSWFWRC